MLVTTLLFTVLSQHKDQVSIKVILINYYFLQSTVDKNAN